MPPLQLPRGFWGRLGDLIGAGCWSKGQSVRVVAFALAWLCGGTAGAHPQFALSTVNRYGKLVLVNPRQARVFYTLMVGDVPALALRQQADRNGDGNLDDTEQQGMAILLRTRIADGVQIYRGETTVLLPWEAAALQLENPAVAAKAFAYELSATIALSDRDQQPPGSAAPTPPFAELRYDDRVELAPVGELELLVEEGPGMRVLQVQSSLLVPPTPGSPPQLLIQWSGPPRSSLSDRSVRVRFTAATPAAKRRPSLFPIRWTWFLGALAATLALIAGFRIRRVGRPS